MSAWDLIRKSAKRKGMVEEEEIPSLRESFILPIVDERSKMKKVVKPIVELTELATYISNGCQLGLGIREIRKTLDIFTKKYEKICEMFGKRSNMSALLHLEEAYSNWSANPDNKVAQFNLIDALARIIEHVKEF